MYVCSYVMIATYITALFIQDIWRDCIKPQEKDLAFNISNHYFSNYNNYEMCVAGRLVLSKMQSH